MMARTCMLPNRWKDISQLPSVCQMLEIHTYLAIFRHIQGSPKQSHGEEYLFVNQSVGSDGQTDRQTDKC